MMCWRWITAIFLCLALQPVIAYNGMAFVCVNLESLTADLEMNDGRVTDVFEGDDASLALAIINRSMPAVFVAGDLIVLGERNDGGNAQAYILNRRGGGYCITAMVRLDTQSAAFIATVVLGQ